MKKVISGESEYEDAIMNVEANYIGLDRRVSFFAITGEKWMLGLKNEWEQKYVDTILV